MHVEAWGLNHSLYLPYVMHGRPSVAASFSLRPQDSLWDGAHDARLTGDVVDEILGGKVDRADWSVAPALARHADLVVVGFAVDPMLDVSAGQV